MSFQAIRKPKPFIGLGLRHSHYTQALDQQSQARPDFVEVHAENFFAAGGASQQVIAQVAEQYPLSLHGTSLGLGSNMPPPPEILARFNALIETTQPILVSEHLCFNRALINDKLVHSGDLLPIAYNAKSLQTMVDNISLTQETFGRSILIENLSAYLLPEQLAGVHSADSMSETEFLIAMCEQAGCGLLLDLNNLIVNHLNQGHENIPPQLAEQVLALPKHLVGEIHLAGYSTQAAQDIIIDDHGAPVSETCWQLYQRVCEHFGHVPTLIEWDTQIPAWSVLIDEANKARAIANA